MFGKIPKRVLSEKLVFWPYFAKKGGFFPEKTENFLEFLVKRGRGGRVFANPKFPLTKNSGIQIEVLRGGGGGWLAQADH